MMNRAVLSLARNQQFIRRSLHKGVDSTPPLRFTSVAEKIALYGFICVAFMSYPTSVLFRLDSLRPRPDNVLAPEVQEEIDARAAARGK
uniref:Cytochrome c oxidase polypeptide VIIc n=1 Tax=Caenorhabditis japonica TaxID=281687 RepID=A0A8R1HRP3_CAEJA